MLIWYIVTIVSKNGLRRAGQLLTILFFFRTVFECCFVGVNCHYERAKKCHRDRGHDIGIEPYRPPMPVVESKR